jgi:nitroimidazol reductase NimA-like FMN-containing flavoprotein (pyridoxamine 5'-phosphate oxidase superfamily)
MSTSRKDTSNLGNSEQPDKFWSIGDISMETGLPEEYKGAVRFEKHGHVRSVSELVEELNKLFSVQNLAVLATSGKAGPYGNLVAFMASHDLKYLVFSTQKATRKFGNLSENPNVAFVIDNRSNKIEDFVNAVAVTAMGKGFEIVSEDREKLLQSFIEKHPHLKDFVTSPSCALVKVEIEKYVCVFRFQNVIELYPKHD